ncbi:MAG TPA: hypothetical protein VG754_04955, partial [Verrucomicrobiae bacterium]|nr:hypothetical protein [Verrucomicrobiae bacterium]
LKHGHQTAFEAPSVSANPIVRCPRFSVHRHNRREHAKAWTPNDPYRGVQLSSFLCALVSLRLCVSSTYFPPSSRRNFRLIPLVSTPFRLIPDKKINFFERKLIVLALLRRVFAIRYPLWGVSLQGKAAEDCRTPRRYRDFQASSEFREVFAFAILYLLSSILTFSTVSLWRSIRSLFHHANQDLGIRSQAINPFAFPASKFLYETVCFHGVVLPAVFQLRLNKHGLTCVLIP